MQPNRPRNLLLIVALQFLTVALLPPDAIAGIGPACGGRCGVAVLGAGFIGSALDSHGHHLLQGMNIIVRCSSQGMVPARWRDWMLLGVARPMALSALILHESSSPSRMLMQ